jgi:hypothetical protein
MDPLDGDEAGHGEADMAVEQRAQVGRVHVRDRSQIV